MKPVVSDTVSLRRLASTIAEIAGWGAESAFPGRSLARLWRPSSDLPEAEEAEEQAMAELIPNESLIPGVPGVSRRPAPLASLSENGWSYIRREGDVHEELYHLREDAREQNNVVAFPASRPRLEQMRDILSRLTVGPLTLDRFNP